MRNHHLLLVILFFLPAISHGQTALIDDQFSQSQKETFETVQGNIMSPYCPGRLLKDCPSSAARDLKLEIKERILEGEAAQFIIEDLLTEFGEDMRASPKAEGVGILAWLAPVIFLFLGFIGILIWVRGQKEAEES